MTYHYRLYRDFGSSMMGLWRSSEILYMIGWMSHTPAVGLEVRILFCGHHVRQILQRWIFPMGKYQVTGVSNRSDNTNRLSCSSACCLYF
ncbi:uncharacterized protein TNCV_4760281 [Trichonephila clavipes]|uniref:Uncharacterized protein n=1 Tax=Trichonephila clavipes TaxID=2585209 RepID=A0A8X6V4S8_TRICX|nr:uncharacterized protein TNCV_4760281 [Trichonephila clavipes]